MIYNSATRTPLKTGVNSRVPEGLAVIKAQIHLLQMQFTRVVTITRTSSTNLTTNNNTVEHCSFSVMVVNRSRIFVFVL